MSGGALLYWVGAAALGVPPQDAKFERHELFLPGPVFGLTTMDGDGDGRHELVVAWPSGVRILPLGGAAGASAPPLAQLALDPSRTLAWCIAREASGRDLLWSVRDDGSIRRLDPVKGDVEIARATGLLLPTGVMTFPFARELDGDGRIDVALPVAGGLKLWFGAADGTLVPGPQVRHRVDIDLALPAPEEASPTVRADFAVPSFQVGDQNGDRRPDLAFKSEQRLQYFWSGPDGQLPATPTFTIELDELRAKLRSTDESMLDPSNLFKALKNQVNARVRDFDGDGAADLLLRQGPKVTVYAGTRDGIDRTKATQILKTSGNLLAAFVADDNGDGRLDLHLLQAADVSLGEVLLWVVAGGSLKLDVYTYFQEEKLRFARSPSRRRRIVVDIPMLLTVADDLKDNEALKRLARELERLPVAVDLDGDGKRTDIAQLALLQVIELYPDAAAGIELAEPGDEEAAWRALLAHYDREARGREEIEVPLLGMVDWMPMPGASLRAALAGRKATDFLGMPNIDGLLAQRGERPEPPRRVLVVLDLDGDRRDDFVLVDQDELTQSVHLEWYTSR